MQLLAYDTAFKALQENFPLVMLHKIDAETVVLKISDTKTCTIRKIFDFDTYEVEVSDKACSHPWIELYDPLFDVQVGRQPELPTEMKETYTVYDNCKSCVALCRYNWMYFQHKHGNQWTIKV